MSDVTGDEFKVFIGILSKLHSIVSQPQNLADVIAEQAELEKSFQVIIYLMTLPKLKIGGEKWTLDF